MGEPEFAELGSFTDQRRNSVVFNLLTVLKVDLKKLTTVCSECDDRFICKLNTAVELELEQ